MWADFESRFPRRLQAAWKCSSTEAVRRIHGRVASSHDKPATMARGFALIGYSPSSLCDLVNAFSSSWLILIFPDFSICSRRLVTNRPNNWPCLACSRESRIWSFLAAKSWSVGCCFSSTDSTMPLLPDSIGPLISPGFRVNATEAPPAMEPTSGTCPSGSTKSLVFTAAPSSLAAFFRSCPALARSESSCVFCESRVAVRSFLNSVSTRLRISSKVGVAGGLMAATSNTA